MKLILPVKGCWFDMMWRGEKPEEYREIKEYWRIRFLSAGLLDFDGKPTGKTATVYFVNGYGRNRPTIKAEVRLSIGPGSPQWGAVPGEEYYRLEIEEFTVLKKSGRMISAPTEDAG